MSLRCSYTLTNGLGGTSLEVPHHRPRGIVRLVQGKELKDVSMIGRLVVALLLSKRSDHHDTYRMPKAFAAAV